MECLPAIIGLLDIDYSHLVMLEMSIEAPSLFPDLCNAKDMQLQHICTVGFIIRSCG